ncbi:MAG: TlpA family protein disulfide reductase, partial [Sphingobacterium sp.]|nr:TlpA family protein disulfide reductase [Sphingobacterium sp.]
EVFLVNHPDSYISLYILNDGGGTQNSSLEERFAALSERVRSSDLGQEMAVRLKATHAVEVGNPAIDFVMNDTEGNPITLSSFRGKYVFLDFWASWCGPCRSENPNLIKAYDKLKGDNFEIIAVSLDNKKDHWLKAIKEDGLPWIQISDLKGTKNEAALKYGVTGIPQNFLISPDGIILGIGFRGENILEKLMEHMK